MKKLYLRNWEYNAAHILQQLENIVLNNGGSIVSTWKTTPREKVEIVNRALHSAIMEHEYKVEMLEARQRPAASKYRAELERMKAIPNDPVAMNYGDWLYISFALNGCYYYYSIDDNPFFDFHFGKTAIDKNGMINKSYYMQKDKKEWLCDCFFQFDCSQADRREAANMIYNMLLSAPIQRGYQQMKTKLYVLEEK